MGRCRAIAAIDGETRLVGLVGWPVEHSMSPAMHNAAFDALGLNWRYVPLPVAPGQVETAIRGLSALGFRGANVTVPHKQAALRALEDQRDSRSTIARDAHALGAINTIVVGRPSTGAGETAFSGYNTDVDGFLRALEHTGFDPDGRSAVVVGAGGAARAVVYGLIKAGGTDVAIVNRTIERAQDLVGDLGRSADVQALPLTEAALIETARDADLLVNATPVGMWPAVDASVWPDDVPVPWHLTVFDLVYNPAETKLQRQARASGANVADGLEMLVRQGALAFALWTEQEAPVDVMRAACRRSLASEASG